VRVLISHLQATAYNCQRVVEIANECVPGEVRTPELFGSINSTGLATSAEHAFKNRVKIGAGRHLNAM
jgi:hypothetical protein